MVDSSFEDTEGEIGSDQEDTFNDIFEQLSLEDEEGIGHSKRLAIFQELRDGPPYAVSSVFKAKHAARVQADQSEYMPEYDEVIVEAEDHTDTPFPPDWHRRKRFNVHMRSSRAESEKTGLAPTASDINSSYEPTFDTAKAPISVTSPTAANFSPTSTASSQPSLQLIVSAAPVLATPAERVCSPVGFWRPDAFRFRDQSPRFKPSPLPPRLSKARSHAANNTAMQAPG